MKCVEKSVKKLVVSAAVLCSVLVPAGIAAAQAQGGGAQDKVAALKQTMQQGMALARKYEWVETTIISMKGEEKSRKQNRCYYGADGKVQKTPIAQPAQQAQAQSGGKASRRGGGRVKEQVIENKKEEMTEYMQKAVALVHSYVPPKPAEIQAAKDAGRIAMNPQSGGKMRLVISQYLKPGDSLTIDMDPATNKLLSLGVNSYLDKKEDVVTLAVKMSSLPDGAIYAGQTTLEAKAKNMTVVVQNTGYKPVQK
jgi:hypothetical protein